jgi:NAD(P)H-hydrate epimerase
VPRSLNPVLETKLTEEMTIPLPETDTGNHSTRSRDLILSLQERWDALVLGPGMGRSAESDRLVRDLYDGWGGSILVDADGLSALAAEGLPQRGPMGPLPVLTPHMGEMSRLSGRSITEIVADPIESARRFAQENGVILVLKGAPTVVAEPGGNVLVNPTGNAGLATGGSGDVLSGVIGTFLAQRIEPWWAAGCGVFLHGWSADRLAARSGLRAIRPLEVVAALGEAWSALEKIPERS